jgi:hypothetical protein
MKLILLAFGIIMAGCTVSEEEPIHEPTNTEACDMEFAPGWGQGYGVEIQVLRPVDPERCAAHSDGQHWCCVL